MRVVLDSGEVIEADHVVLALGAEPETDLAERAGLEVSRKDGGIVVNAELEARRDVFVAGDAASYHDIALGRRRVEHHDHAFYSGLTAGRNKTGARVPYMHQSMFWSDLLDMSYEAVGVVDNKLETLAFWAGDSDPTAADAAQEQAKGVIYYLRSNRVVGAVLWNVEGKVDAARRVILSGRKVGDASDLAGEIKLSDPVDDLLAATPTGAEA